MSEGKGVNGPTDHQVLAALGEGKAIFDQQTEYFVLAIELAKQQVKFHEAQCLEGAGVSAEANDDDTDYSKQLARFVWTARGYLVTALLGLVAGLALLAGGGLVAPFIEWSLFYGLFRVGYENIYGEITPAGAFLAGLVAAQAVLAIFAVKFWMRDGRRTALMSGIAFVIAILFMAGAVLERGHTLVSQNQTSVSADGVLALETTDQTTPPMEQADALLGHLSPYLLSLGFVLVPIVAALMFSAGWKAFTEGMVQRRTAQDYLFHHEKMRAAAKTLAESETSLRRYLARQQDIVIAPLNDLIASTLREAKATQDAIKNARQSGLADVLPPDMPGAPGMKMTDLDAAEQDVEAIRDKYGNGFVKDAFDTFIGRSGAPPNNQA